MKSLLIFLCFATFLTTATDAFIIKTPKTGWTENLNSKFIIVYSSVYDFVCNEVHSYLLYDKKSDMPTSDTRYS